MIYKEIHVPNDGKTYPTFPQRCPVCKEGVDVESKDTLVYSYITYKCGGEYQWKSQIQNHTNKWWGKCTKDFKCESCDEIFDEHIGDNNGECPTCGANLPYNNNSCMEF